MINSQEQAKKILEKWNYETVRKIGKGGFGHVVLATRFTNSMNFYAIKCISMKANSKDPNYKRYVEREIKTMCEFKHQNIVHLQHAFQDGGWHFIVMEYCELGNLYNYQSKNHKKVFTLAEASKLLFQIIDGVQAIHNMNIVHRDLKSENIFLKKNKNGNGFQCKIGDFGFAKQIDQTTRTSCGTTYYMAPQVLKKIPYGFEADVWSIGVLFYFMIFGDFPFKGLNIEKDITEKCANGFRLAQTLAISKQLKEVNLVQNLFTKIFNLNQKQRISLDQIVHHKLFKSHENQKTESSFSDDQLEEDLQLAIGKVNFIDQVMKDILLIKFLEPSLLNAVRFYLLKVSRAILHENKIMSHLNEQPKKETCLVVKEKQATIFNDLQTLFGSMKKCSQLFPKIGKFQQGFNLELQDFYAIKQGYRNTLSTSYKEAQKKINNPKAKALIKLQILCCHLINRVFDESFKSEIFPNFHSWLKKQKKNYKEQINFERFRQWMIVESIQKLIAETENISNKFYS